MNLLENVEQLSSIKRDSKDIESLSDAEKDYVGECLVPPRPDELVMRIDEIQGGSPPKAIDSNPELAELIESVKDKIPSKYLEAPSDVEQVEQISDTMAELDGLRIENWSQLSIRERVELLKELENKIADIEHRDSCHIDVKDMGEVKQIGNELSGHMGVHSTNRFGWESITINSKLVESNNPRFLKEVLNTILHEGRHSYQTFNMIQRETHTSHGDITNWRWNQYECGYQDARICGFRAYWMQPLECDARKFAEDVLIEYRKKI